MHIKTSELAVPGLSLAIEIVPFLCKISVFAVVSWSMAGRISDGLSNPRPP